MKKLFTIKNILTFVFAPLGVVFAILMMTSMKPTEKPPIIQTIYVDKPIYIDKFIPISIFVEGMSINEIISFYKESNWSDYNKIIEFYTMFTRNRDISIIILEESLKSGIAVNQAMALAWRESGFDPNTYYENGKSIDRGLFQLNNLSRPKWKKSDFYNPRKNAIEAMACLTWLKGEFKTDELALAAYNAGYGSLNRKTIPYSTSIHVFEIRNYERMLDKEFNGTILTKLSGIEFKDEKVILNK